MRPARHDSAAVQRRKPVAALVVDWFYVTASFQVGSLLRGMMSDREASCTTLSTFNMHLSARAVKRGTYHAGGQLNHRVYSECGAMGRSKSAPRVSALKSEKFVEELGRVLHSYGLCEAQLERRKTLVLEYRFMHG